jgi:UDP-glucuronate 4-epimerase
MKLLVTGGAGFIGSHLVEKLIGEGHEVSILDDFNDFYDPSLKRKNLEKVKKDIQVFESDIRNQADVLRVVKDSGCEGIFHLAARAGVRPSILNPQLYLDTNVTGTLNLLEAAKKNQVSQFIFGSSSSVYGTIKTVPFSENMCLNQTISPYAASKLAGEQLCSNFSHLYGIRCVSLRLFTVYGPRQRPDLAIHSFARSILEGKPIKQFGDGSTMRDYTYVDDIVAGLIKTLEYKGPIYDVFNLGESQTTTLSQLISLLEEALGRPAKIERLPDQLGDVPVTYADISKARLLISYEPKFLIKEGICKFVEWLLAN